MFVAISIISRARLAATTSGGTVAVNAASNAPADKRAWLATSSAFADVPVNHRTQGVAAVAIIIDAGPCQTPPVSVDTVDAKALAAEANCAASASQAAAAAQMVPERGPAYMRAELISGGNSTKSGNIRDLFSAHRYGRCDEGSHPLIRTSSHGLRK
ncbi:hypothetical protein MSTO_14440 [Mycobacterium stomatepiae]|uniref:Uncharacterized protein n=1 Tax=Mycobacterium stomatepiae TaxID=470076 RepID=A0A7I7Q4Q6_9MYCO|nr:hypothetical protein MSTO_14440 [Mycobacterium stomatepiae]